MRSAVDRVACSSRERRAAEEVEGALAPQTTSRTDVCSQLTKQDEM